MNQNNEPQSSYAACIGLDRSDQKINVSLQRSGNARIERSLMKGSAEALHAWVATLCAQFPHQQIALEQPASGSASYAKS